MSVSLLMKGLAVWSNHCIKDASKMHQQRQKEASPYPVFLEGQRGFARDWDLPVFGRAVN